MEPRTIILLKQAPLSESQVPKEIINCARTLLHKTGVAFVFPFTKTQMTSTHRNGHSQKRTKETGQLNVIGNLHGILEQKKSGR